MRQDLVVGQNAFFPDILQRRQREEIGRCDRSLAIWTDNSERRAVRDERYGEAGRVDDVARAVVAEDGVVLILARG